MGLLQAIVAFILGLLAFLGFPFATDLACSFREPVSGCPARQAVFNVVEGHYECCIVSGCFIPPDTEQCVPVF